MLELASPSDSEAVDIELASPTMPLATRGDGVLATAGNGKFEPLETASAASVMSFESSGAPDGARTILARQFFSVAERERQRSKRKKNLPTGTVHKPTVRLRGIELCSASLSDDLEMCSAYLKMYVLRSCVWISFFPLLTRDPFLNFRTRARRRRTLSKLASFQLKAAFLMTSAASSSALSSSAVIPSFLAPNPPRIRAVTQPCSELQSHLPSAPT